MCSTSAADKLKADKDTPQALKDFGLRISKLLVSIGHTGFTYVSYAHMYAFDI